MYLRILSFTWTSLESVKTFSDLQFSNLRPRANLNSGVLMQMNVRDSARTFKVREDREMQFFNKMNIQ